jgi:hypothetical protein
MKLNPLTCIEIKIFKPAEPISAERYESLAMLKLRILNHPF